MDKGTLNAAFAAWLGRQPPTAPLRGGVEDFIGRAKSAPAAVPAAEEDEEEEEDDDYVQEDEDDEDDDEDDDDEDEEEEEDEGEASGDEPAPDSNWFGRAAAEGAAPKGTNPFALPLPDLGAEYAAQLADAKKVIAERDARNAAEEAAAAQKAGGAPEGAPSAIKGKRSAAGDDGPTDAGGSPALNVPTATGARRIVKAKRPAARAAAGGAGQAPLASNPFANVSLFGKPPS